MGHYEIAGPLPERYPHDHIVGFPGEETNCQCDRCVPPMEKAKALAKEYNLPWPEGT